MRQFKIRFCENLNKYLICSTSFMLLGIIALAVFGIDLDINFKGGSRFTYSYVNTEESKLDMDEVKSIVDEALGVKATVTSSTGVSDSSSYINITTTDTNAISTEKQTALTTALAEAYPDNSIELGDANTVNPSVAGSFFLKSITAVLLAGALIVVFVAFRFRNNGGFRAGICAFIALIHDVLIAFFFCVIFRLQIDTNFMAVVLTIFGYSINDTVVVYDRIRENRRYYPDETLREATNKSINQVLTRTIMTSLTTVVAIVVIGVVAELNGITSLRTFAIPMAVGSISGCYSSDCISVPLWVKWNEYLEAHPKKTKKSK